MNESWSCTTWPKHDYEQHVKIHKEIVRAPAKSKKTAQAPSIYGMWRTRQTVLSTYTRVVIYVCTHMFVYTWIHVILQQYCIRATSDELLVVFLHVLFDLVCFLFHLNSASNAEASRTRHESSSRSLIRLLRISHSWFGVLCFVCSAFAQKPRLLVATRVGNRESEWKGIYLNKAPSCMLCVPWT